MQTIHIPLKERAYDIHIGEQLLSAISCFDGLGLKSNQAVIVTNTTVAPLYATALEAQLKGRYRQVQTLVLPDGEVYKDWTSLNLIFDALLGGGADRQTFLYALGGGVIGDMTGFAASCYMRGIPFVQVPTTLLAQVDSSVGGKTAINHPLGKNMIGAFYQPQRVIADISTLSTLPKRELNAGLAELVKYGPIYDADFFDWLVVHVDQLLALDSCALIEAIARACQIKADIVAQDEREQGLRAILNFGHTFAHAIETGVGYGVWLHGEAVACGMVMAAELSVRLGLLEGQQAQQICHLVEKIGLPSKAPALGVERYLELMQRDKKNAAGKIRYVLLDRIGHAVVEHVPEQDVRAVLQDYQMS